MMLTLYCQLLYGLRPYQRMLLLIPHYYNVLYSQETFEFENFEKLIFSLTSNKKEISLPKLLWYRYYFTLYGTLNS